MAAPREEPELSTADEAEEVSGEIVDPELASLPLVPVVAALDPGVGLSPGRRACGLLVGLALELGRRGVLLGEFGPPAPVALADVGDRRRASSTPSSGSRPRRSLTSASNAV